jgi:hypothetical protein
LSVAKSGLAIGAATKVEDRSMPTNLPPTARPSQEPPHSLGFLSLMAIVAILGVLSTVALTQYGGADVFQGDPGFSDR